MSDDITIAQEIRNRRHAKAEAKSAAKRRKAKAPRRDDIARAAYYALLLACREAIELDNQHSANLIQESVIRKLEKAGFDRAATEEAFKDHVRTAKVDLHGWLAARKIVRERAAEADLRSAAE